MGMFNNLFGGKEKRNVEKKYTQLMSDALRDGSSAAGKAMSDQKKWKNGQKKKKNKFF